ncbi:VOC family protein [Pseudomonas phoenicis]|uniref:VOC family protein n=1 Tax=unclassified Pseudomonas TaxID=196821 RepID=UPI0039A35ED6
MKIVVTRIFVDDQAKAGTFYHHILGFEPKQDVPMGQHRWLTFTSPGDSHGVQLSLEPIVHPAAGAFQAALKADELPAITFEVRSVEEEYLRLTKAGVEFVKEPIRDEGFTVAIFDDTCGNLVQLAQRH